jgi:hypothetical protein
VSGTTIAIIVAAGVVAALLIALIASLVRRRRRAAWLASARAVAADMGALAAAVERSLPMLRDPNTAAQVWADLDSRAARVRARLRVLGESAPGGAANAAARRAAQALQALQTSIDTDRGLRVGPPAPTPEQLGYSEALLRQRAAELQQVAADLEAPPALR